jgi:hypothetical protein
MCAYDSSLPNIIWVNKSIKMTEVGVRGTYSGQEVCMHTGFGGKPEGKRQLGTPLHRWEDNIKIDLQEMDRRVWTGLICIRAEVCVWAVMNTVMIL